ncbi:YtxH domain-containing protein [Companilactobacillus musae]|uniref:YtxH domain-containing protein n=1 Tax=Companilactobacillus musae TaxID=1903258 RepID=UPI000E6472A3|nr:YtxH domain-containing protein [Companilactobacillus musae]
MKNNHFLLGLALGCASGYVASKYLTSESGQKLLENIKTIRGDFNNGGVGLSTNSDLVDSFNEKTDALKDQMASTVDKFKDDDDNSDIIFDEDDINK